MSDVRRFFFDDGTSRKRWHVHVQGKSQVVWFGRLGGSLKESRKSFKTSAEAAEKSERLVAAKKREGYVEIDPARLEIVRIKGKNTATQQQIKALEKRIGCKLPEEYRDFLMKYNGGRPNPRFVRVPGIKGIANVGVDTLFHLQPSQRGVDELSHEIARCQKLLPQGHLPIAGSSDLFTLSLKPKTFGAVYWWFHETDEADDDGNYLESAGHLLAGSFDEFLTRIALAFGADDLSPETTTSKSGATRKKPRASIKQLLRLVNHDHTPEKIKEIEQVAKELNDLSGIQDGEWPFINISSPRVVHCLLEAGLNPEITDTDGHSLLWQCASSQECISLLAKHKVRIDRRSGGDNETALMRAIYLEDIPAVKRLLELGANPTVRLRSHAIQSKLQRNDQLRQLLDQARDHWRENHGQSQSLPNAAKPKSTAAETKSNKSKPTLNHLLRLMKHDHITDECDEVEEIVEVISELGDLSGIQDGEWPNIDQFESPRLLRCLLEAGLNPEILDKDGNSLLSQCVVHPDCIELLVERGVAVDRRSGRDDMTALMRATYKGDQECVQRLLDAGADPTLEFSKFARLMLNMDEEMKTFIESAREDWKRNKL
jgi:ankyrin repeat protein/predicted DNA-binding WGR domain protein